MQIADFIQHSAICTLQSSLPASPALRDRTELECVDGRLFQTEAQRLVLPLMTCSDGHPTTNTADSTETRLKLHGIRSIPKTGSGSQTGGRVSR